MNASNELRADGFPPSFHAYCSSSALCMAFAIDRQEKPTITLEFAHKAENRKFDWDNKVAFQLTHGDLAGLCAFLFYPSNESKWVHKSPSGEAKTLTVEDQNPVILFSITTKGRRINTPVVPKDQYFFRNLLLSRLTEIQPALAPELQMNSLRLLAKKHQ